MSGGRKNVVIIHTDEHYHGFLGCMGHPLLRTPNIDALAAEGSLFRSAYTCNGVCIPSRASLQTGRYPIGHGMTSNDRKTLNSDEVTMADRFGRAGYATGYFGKMHYGRGEDPVADGWGEGFSATCGYRDYLKEHGIDVRYPERKEIRHPEVRYWNIGTSNIPAEHYFENVIGDRAAEFISRERNEPFCCFVGMIAPHGPFTPPKPYDEMYDPDEVELLPRCEKGLAGKPEPTVKWITQNQEYLSERELRLFLAATFGLITLVDDNVGKIVSVLKEAGVYDDTIIVFTSDHGDFCTQYRMFGKSWAMDECLMRIPLIISAPGQRGEGRVVDSLVESVDILSTLLDYAGIPAPKRTHGTSLMPIVRGETDAVKDVVFGHNEFSRTGCSLAQSMVRAGKWKLVHAPAYHDELYDLDADPWEEHNLIDEPGHADTIAELRARLLDWHTSCTGGYYDPDSRVCWEEKFHFYEPEKFNP